MRKTIKPGNLQSNSRDPQPVTVNRFGRGQVKDVPASTLQGTGAMAEVYNADCYPSYAEGRLGYEYFEALHTPITGRTGYSAHKVGNTIISDSGDIFTQADLGNYWGWGNGIFDELIEYIDAQHMVCNRSGTDTGTECFIRGLLGMWEWHTSSKVWFFQLCNDFYHAEWDIVTKVKSLILSRDVPASALSTYGEIGDDAVVFNPNGIFRILVDQIEQSLSYKTNIPAPNVRVSDTENFVGANHRRRYLYTAARLTENGNLVSRISPSKIELETGTTEIGDDGRDYGEVYTENDIDDDNPVTVQTFWVPVVPNTDPQEFQWHLTHFPIYCTLDLEALDLDDVRRVKYNDPNEYTWAKDLRIAAAFFCYRYNGVITAERGVFEKADEYSIIEFEDGQRFEILEYIDAYHVRYAIDYYYGGDNSDWQAAAIGNGRVIRGTVTGTTFHRIAGSQFSASDVRKTILDSDGNRLYITEYTDADNVEVHINNDRPEQGFTMDPTHRKYRDVIPDTTLRARKATSAFRLKSRFYTQIPNCNVGAVIPGFVACAKRTDKKLYYQALTEERSYLLGQHHPTQVKEDIQGEIQIIKLFPDVFAVICGRNTWYCPVGVSDLETDPNTGEQVSILPTLKQASPSIGCTDVGSINDVEKGLVILLTNEPGGVALRYFNGMQYSEQNLLEDPQTGEGRNLRAVRNTKMVSVSMYDGVIGYLNWRKKK